jgi:hypothetical protein
VGIACAIAEVALECAAEARGIGKTEILGQNRD